MIRMSKETDYAIVLLSVFARVSDPVVYSARELSDRTQVPLPMVSKVLKSLAKGGLLRSVRGPRGGYSLVRRAREISIVDVLRAMEGSVALTECLDQPGDCVQEPICRVRGSWELINDRVVSALEQVTIAEMVEPRTQLVELETEPVAGF